MLATLRPIGRFAPACVRRIATIANRFPTRDVAILNRAVAYALAAPCAAAVVYQLVVLEAVVVSPISRVSEGGDAPAPFETPRPVRLEQDAIPRAHLFGVAGSDVAATPSVQAVTAPDTTLDVKLTGILFGKDPQHREAIISSNGRDRAYRPGQEIDGAGGATVRDVFTDSVVLERQGSSEMLRLVRYAEEPRTAAASAAQASAKKPAGNALRSWRNDFLRLMRKSEDGRVVGFAVMPGPNKDAFDTLGLQSNDIITRLDGIALADHGGDSLLLERLAGGGSLTLTVLRSGVAQDVRIDADRLPAGGG